MPSKSSSSSPSLKKQKPLQLDCTALMNHLSLIQHSIPYMHLYQKQLLQTQSNYHLRRRHTKPNLQMVNFSTSTTGSNKRYREWYILVASTPFAISAQLVPAPKTREGVVEPDLIQCTPISIWTCAETNEIDLSDVIHSNVVRDHDTEDDTTNAQNHKLEILSCDPVILIQESPKHHHINDLTHHNDGGGGGGGSFMVSVVLGTSKSRVLCVQLSIFNYVGVGGVEEGRLVLSKTDENSDKTIRKGSILEPLPLDTDEYIRRKLGETTSHGNHTISPSHSQHTDGQYTVSGNVGTNSKDTTNESQHPTQWVPFRPTGGVSALSPLYRFRNNNINIAHSRESKSLSNGDFMWITYRDGMMVRLPRWAFFPIHDEYYDDDDNDFDVNKMQMGPKLQDRIVKAMVLINPTKSSGYVGTDVLTRVPLPHFFPSLMSQPLLSSTGATSSSSSHRYIHVDECDDGSGFFSASHSISAPAIAEYESYEAISFGQENIEKNGDSYISPTLSFYTNENQLFSKTHKNSNEAYEELNTVQSIIKGGTSIIGGTAAIAKGMLGGMMGVMLGRSKQTEEDNMKRMDVVGENNDENSHSISSHNLFPAIHEESNKLPLASTLFDTPRTINHASIDPVDGVLMACADSLGRVQLIDLSTKQVIRLWKGVRDASCHWIQFPFRFETGSQIVKYLTIHCRERKVVEIYRMRFGPRVGKFSTTSDAQVVQCAVALKGNKSLTKCFILQCSQNSKRYIAKELMVHDSELNEVVVEASSTAKKSVNQSEKYLANHQSLTQGTIQLQLLKQLLGSEMPSDLDTIYAALTQITAISDLRMAIDLLAVASRLEEMGVHDSSFHCEVINHVQEQLDIAISDEIIASSNNPLLDDLQSKIDFHKKLIESFDVLHQFEISNYSDNDHDDSIDKSKSSWVQEALSWIAVAEKVYGHSIDVNIFSEDESNLSFSVWSKGCLQDIQNTKLHHRNDDGHPMLYLCDSTRDRKNILLHVFKPLTKDIFAFKTTQQIFENMGIEKDYDVLLQYYGEWFMTLPKSILQKECLGISCPTVRWLHNIVHQMVDDMVNQTKEGNEAIVLKRLHNFCLEATDLPRAFLLATVCRDAILMATKQLEDKTYGIIGSDSCVKPWEQLLRKLRVCLMVALRLHGQPVGQLPISVSNVEKGEFSIYQWIARDLISLDQEHLDIVSLEIACRNSKIAFFPSSRTGDDSSNWKMVQNSCWMVTSQCPTEQSQPGPLLFFFKNYNHPRILGAHRALLFGQKWGREPESIDLLDDILANLQNIGRDEESYSSLLAAVLLEIWQTHIRPIYRALLFGFHEVDELCEDIIAPLLLDKIWFQKLNKISMKIIMLLLCTTDSEPYDEIDDLSDHNNDEEDDNDETYVWPKLREDIIIKSLFDKSITLEESSLEVHHSIICAVQLNNDLSLLPNCVESFDSLFLKQSLNTPFSRSFRMSEEQQIFVEGAIRLQAELAEGPTINRDYLDDLVTLGRFWGLDKGHILTKFLLVMYELGKDDIVEDFMTSVNRLIDVEMFLDEGIPIVCVRLNTALNVLKKAKQCRGIMAMLDADTCEWVREQGKITSLENPDIVVLNEDGTLISLDSTHALLLRMKRMSSVNRIDAYALFTMCETLLQAMNTM